VTCICNKSINNKILKCVICQIYPEDNLVSPDNLKSYSIFEKLNDYIFSKHYNQNEDIIPFLEAFDFNSAKA